MGYWAAEAFVVAIVAWGMMKKAASQPFCTNCQSWKRRRFLGTVRPSRAQADDRVTRGDIALLSELEPSSEYNRELHVAVSVCPIPGADAPVDVLLHSVVKGKKNETKTTELPTSVIQATPGGCCRRFFCPMRRRRRRTQEASGGISNRCYSSSFQSIFSPPLRVINARKTRSSVFWE